MLEGKHVPGTAEPDLHLVDQKHDAVLAADPLEALQEVRRRDDVASVALHRFDNDARSVLRRADSPKDVTLKIVEYGVTRVTVGSEHRPVRVRVRNLDHVPTAAGLGLGRMSAEPC